MENSDYSVHIIGTPSNSGGFQQKTLTQNDLLKKEYAQYLDKFDSNEMKQGYTYIIDKKTVENNEYTFLSILRKLDIVNNRGGAYIGIAIVIKGYISLNDSILYYQIISEVYGHLSAYIVDDKFIDGFQIDHYYYPIDKTIDATYLLDMLSKISNGTVQKGGLGTIRYNNKNHPNPIYKNKTFDIEPFEKEFERKMKVFLEEQKVKNEKLSFRNKILESKNEALENSTSNNQESELIDEMEQVITKFKSSQKKNLNRR